jgi:hypothetical protein
LRSRECSRQVRGEVRAPRPCSRALARHGPRGLLRQRAARESRPRRGALTGHGPRGLLRQRAARR